MPYVSRQIKNRKEQEDSIGGDHFLTFFIRQVDCEGERARWGLNDLKQGIIKYVIATKLSLKTCLLQPKP